MNLKVSMIRGATRINVPLATWGRMMIRARYRELRREHGVARFDAHHLIVNILMATPDWKPVDP